MKAEVWTPLGHLLDHFLVQDTILGTNGRIWFQVDESVSGTRDVMKVSSAMTEGVAWKHSWYFVDIIVILWKSLSSFGHQVFNQVFGHREVLTDGTKESYHPCCSLPKEKVPKPVPSRGLARFLAKAKTAYRRQHTEDSIPKKAYRRQHTEESIPKKAYRRQHTEKWRKPSRMKGIHHGSRNLGLSFSWVTPPIRVVISTTLRRKGLSAYPKGRSPGTLRYIRGKVVQKWPQNRITFLLLFWKEKQRLKSWPSTTERSGLGPFVGQTTERSGLGPSVGQKDCLWS